MTGTTLSRGDGWKTELPVEHLVSDYINEMKRFNTTKRGNSTAMGRFLNKVCPKIKVSSRKADLEVQEEHWTRHVHRRTRWYLLPSLERARETWEEQYGTTDWDEIIEEE